MKQTLLFLLFCTSLFAGDQRIVTLAPSINEILFALGKGDKIVGNTTYATYPKKANSITKVGGYFSVSIEKIIALKPSLVLMQKNNLPIKPKLEKMGIDVEFIKIDSLKSIKEGIKRVASLTGATAEAKKIISDIESAVKNSSGILKDKKILIVFGRQFDLKKEIYVSGNSIHFADIIRASGNQNAFKEQTTAQPMLSYEGIVASNPDIVYILAHFVKEADKIELIAPWLSLPITASKAKTIYVNTKQYASMPSNRVVNYISDFTEILKDARSRLETVQD